ncbi:MAG: hypothetical protein WC792_05240 [Candidatus Micrarchaeia archaeon]
MSDAFFEAKLIEIIGGYDHCLTVVLSDGSLLDLWDPDCHALNEMLGKSVRLSVDMDTNIAPHFRVEKISPRFSVTQKAGPIEGRLGGLSKISEGVLKGCLNGFIDVKVAKFNFTDLPDRGGFKDGDFVRIYEVFPNQPITGPALVVHSAELLE